jgi:hypothetical protein
VQRGTPWANGTIQIDPTVRFPKTDTATLKFTASEDYGNGGLNFYGALSFQRPILIEADETILQLSIFTADATMNEVVARMSTGPLTFNNTSGSWTMDGKPGQTTELTQNEWHTLRLDLSSHPNFKPGTSMLDGDGISFKVSQSGTTAYLGDIRLTSEKSDDYVDIPESNSYTLMLGTITLASTMNRRRRRNV